METHSGKELIYTQQKQLDTLQDKVTRMDAELADTRQSLERANRTEDNQNYELKQSRAEKEGLS